MRPYGQVHDGHQYLLNDEGKRDAVFAKWAKSRERLGAKRQVERELVELADEADMRRMQRFSCPCGGAEECVDDCERCYFCECACCGC